jgi:hypothetical protein
VLSLFILQALLMALRSGTSGVRAALLLPAATAVALLGLLAGDNDDERVADDEPRAGAIAEVEGLAAVDEEAKIAAGADPRRWKMDPTPRASKMMGDDTGERLRERLDRAGSNSCSGGGAAGLRERPLPLAFAVGSATVIYFGVEGGWGGAL